MSDFLGATTASGTLFQVVDARTQAEYLAGHVPGALLLEWEKWCEKAPASAGAQLAEPGYWGKLADPLQCDAAGRLSALGLNSNQPIVVYADGIKSKGGDGRVAWMLLYFGACDVYLLDGGWSAWCDAGGEIASGTAAAQAGNFDFNLRSERRVLLDQMILEVSSANTTLIDTRCAAEFAGDCYD